MENIISSIPDTKLFRMISNQTNDGINIVNENGILLFVNTLSADYAESTVSDMIGKHISLFYRDAAALDVLKTKQPIKNQKIVYEKQRKYIVSSYPLFDAKKKFVGAYSIFKDIQDIENLNRKVKYLELQVGVHSDAYDENSVIGETESLKNAFQKARKSVGSLGGPRHSIITGQSGTGKTMLANIIYNYAKKIGAIDKKAPFIEINCAQFTNPDIAAVEIFGSEEGAYTGSKKKRGLFEQAHGGILFLDEAHALESYQNLLLKAIESGKIRRIGGTSEIDIDVIIIAASTKKLKEVFLPELYQRLAQYEIYIPSLSERSMKERADLFHYFVNNYRKKVQDLHNITADVVFTKEASDILLNADYPRNIRQFRDIINYCIDVASPLLENIATKKQITILVERQHIPYEAINSNQPSISASYHNRISINTLIDTLYGQGLGARKIAKKLQNEGHRIEYYQVAYYLKKQKNTEP